MREAIRAVSASHRRLIVSLVVINKPLLLASLDDGSYPDVWPHMLRSLVPGVNLNFFYANLEPVSTSAGGRSDGCDGQH